MGDFLDEVVKERTKKSPKFPELVRKASGRNIAEDERNTVRVRVSREDAERLARKWRCSVAEAVARSISDSLRGV